MRRARTTKRGTGVTRTRSCRVQATFDAVGNPSVIPFLPAKPLQARTGMYVKYYLPAGGAGKFFVRGDALSGASGEASAYPIEGKTGSDFTRHNRRKKQIFLPVTGLVRVYAVRDTFIEFGSTLEVE